jgi:large subunit ribosomal protein L32
MAVPKKKRSPSRQGMRCGHMKVSSDALQSCSHCGGWKRPHHICSECGHYKGKQILVPKAMRRAQRAAEETS